MSIQVNGTYSASLTEEQRRQLHELKLRRRGRTLSAEELALSDALIEFNEEAASARNNDERQDLVTNFPVVKYDPLVELQHDLEWMQRPPVEFKNKDADKFWGGATYKPYSQTRKQEDFVNWFDIGYDSEALVNVYDDGFGNRIIRYWLSREHNITARIRKAGPQFRVEFFLNVKNEHGRWTAKHKWEFKVNRTVTDEAERAIARGVAIEFAKAIVAS